VCSVNGIGGRPSGSRLRSCRNRAFSSWCSLDNMSWSVHSKIWSYMLLSYNISGLTTISSYCLSWWHNGQTFGSEICNTGSSPGQNKDCYHITIKNTAVTEQKHKCKLLPKHVSNISISHIVWYKSLHSGMAAESDTNLHCISILYFTISLYHSSLCFTYLEVKHSLGISSCLQHYVSCQLELLTYFQLLVVCDNAYDSLFLHI